MIDLSGRTFGRLLVLERSGSIKTNVAWMCRCECGTETRVSGNRLRSGHTRSCGCLAIEAASERRTTHGMSTTRLFKIWSGMKTRCNNPKSSSWAHYGGRGIRICSVWESFAQFCAWALANGYADNLSIDRVDVDGSYSPDNCRWATTAEQKLNTRKNKLPDGRRVSVVAAANGLKLETVRWRIRHGWDATVACTTGRLNRWTAPDHYQHHPLRR